MRDHVEDPLLAPRRDPLDVTLDRVEGARTKPELVELDEPLLGRTEERRVLAAPAVRVRVVERTLGDEHAERPEVLDDLRVGVPDGEPREALHPGDEAPVVIDRVVDLEPERPPELVVLLPVARGDVDQPRARIHRDERRGGHLARAVDPRVTVLEAHEMAPGDPADLPRAVQARGRDEGVGQLGGDDERLAAMGERDVRLVRVDGDGEVRRERPRRGGPDHQGGRGRVRRGRQRAEEREPDVDRRRALVLVLDLGLGERRLAVHAPVDRLQPFVDETAADEASELARDDRLVIGRHRDVGVLPVAEDAKPLELVPLNVDEA